MDNDKITEFDAADRGLDLRCVYLENIWVNPDDEAAIADPDLREYEPRWFWFASSHEIDRWINYAVASAFTDGDEVESLDGIDLEILRRMAIWCGDKWENIIDGCPHCSAIEHRIALDQIPGPLYSAIVEMEIDRLFEMRQLGEWRAFQSMFAAMTGGMILSIN
jgi:hypothetical protein